MMAYMIFIRQTHSLTPKRAAATIGAAAAGLMCEPQCGCMRACVQATAEAQRPRGFAFWNIALEGAGANGTAAPLAFAPALNAFLHTRPGR